MFYSCLDGGACNSNSTATFHDESFCNYPGDECVVTTDLNGDSIYGFYDENCECMPHDFFVQEQITSKKLIKAMNVLGQENTLNRFRIEIYDDGSVQKGEICTLPMYDEKGEIQRGLKEDIPSSPIPWKGISKN